MRLKEIVKISGNASIISLGEENNKYKTYNLNLRVT